MFKPHWGNCPECPKDKVSVIVAKNGLCKFHNEDRKKSKKSKKPKQEKPAKQSKAFKPHMGNCSCCGQPGMITVKSGLRQQCNEKKKQEAKSRRVVKLVNKAEKNKSHPGLKKQLWEIVSEYIRLRDSKDGMFTCISCGRFQSAAGGNLQAGHYYKSETYPNLRYDDKNNLNGQCLSCNIFKEGNRQGYEIGLIKKYGQKAIDDLKLRAHNKVRLGRFELELLIKEFTEKLNTLKQQRSNGNEEAL